MYNIKISDFGLARMLEKRYYYSNPRRKLPWEWTAIEALQMRKFSTKSDGMNCYKNSIDIVSYSLELWRCFVGNV
jgi:hypothetical protein